MEARHAGQLDHALTLPDPGDDRPRAVPGIADGLATFCGLALVQACAAFPPESVLKRAGAPLLAALRPAAWLTVVLCVVRGLPVIAGSLRRHWQRAPMLDVPGGAP